MSVVDITARRFSSTRRGYDRAEVDSFLDEVAAALQRDRHELRAALRRIEELEDRLAWAKAQAEIGTETVLYASEMKQRLLEDATERAMQIIRAGYSAMMDDEHEIDRLVDAERVELLAIWDTAEDGTPLLDLPSTETRYHRQSAHLPRLGDETNRVLDDVADLRSRALRHK